MDWRILLAASCLPVGLAYPIEPKSYDYVINLMDSDFVIQDRIEYSLNAAQEPDSAMIRDWLNSDGLMYSFGVKVAGKPVNATWLAYAPPADPGAIYFLTNTIPIIPILVLRLDAMCDGCVWDYSSAGTHSIPAVERIWKPYLEVLPMENPFGLGAALSDAEKDSIAEAINDYSISVSKSVPSISVLKLDSRYPSIRGIRYVCRYTLMDGHPAPVNPRPSIRRPRFTDAESRVDALGRHSAGRKGIGFGFAPEILPLP